MARVFRKVRKDKTTGEYTRLSDQWWIDFADANGVRQREPVAKGATFAVAKQRLAQRMAEVAEGRYFPARATAAQAFEEVADKFLADHVSTLRSRSWKGMLKTIRVTFGGKRIGDITVADAQRFYNNTLARTSASTANRYLTLLSSLFNKARDWKDFHGENPCSSVTQQPEADHKTRNLSDDEISSLYRVAHPRLLPFVTAAILTGMRKGELLKLDWSNVSLERRTVFLLGHQTKSGKGRTLPITPRLQEVLVALDPKPSGSVFNLPDIMLRRYFARALKDAKLSGVTLHTLRHTAASHWAANGVDIYTIKTLLGHSSIKMTERYAHLAQGFLAAKMAAAEASLPSQVVPSPLVWQKEISAAFDGPQVAKA